MVWSEGLGDIIQMREHLFLALYTAYCVLLWQLFFFFLLKSSPNPLSLCWCTQFFNSSAGPWAIEWPCFPDFFFFPKVEILCIFWIRYIEPLSPHISWSPLKYLKNKVNGTQYLLNLQSNEDFSCSFVIKPNHCCKGEKGNSSHLQSFKPSGKGRLSSHIQTGKGVFRGGCVCLTNAKWKMLARGLQYMVYF